MTVQLIACISGLLPGENENSKPQKISTLNAKYRTIELYG
jgi:hypothetical protein